MNRPAGVQSLPADNWIPLDQALSWICFDAAIDLDRLLSDALPLMGVTPDEAMELYQEAWRELAEFSSINRLVVRGYRRRKQSETQSRTLSDDDLYNCRFIDFVQTLRGRTILLSRYDRDHEGVWQTIVDEEGSDFAHVLIRRADLLKFKRRARPTTVNRRSSMLQRNAALALLRNRIQGKDASQVRREQLIKEIREQHGVSLAIAREIWREATEDRPDLRHPGRRKRSAD